MSVQLDHSAPAAAGAGEPAIIASPLARCFALTPSQFAARHWNRAPLLVRAAERASASFGDLLSAADVDEMLGSRGLRTPFFRLVQDGTGLPVSSYTRRGVAGGRELSDLPDADRIAAAHAGGATVVLNALHRVHPPLAAFCRALSAELGHATQVNAYVTPPGAQGFRPHHDTHDVLVLQVDGRKHWTIHDPQVELPMRSQPSSALGPDPAHGKDVAVDAVLEPGDALYLPRGWLHSAQTTNDRSIHLTVGILATTWADVLADAVASAGLDDVRLRHALPLPGSSDRSALAGFRAAVADWVQSLDDDRVLLAVAHRRSKAVALEPVGALAQDRAARTLGTADAVRPRQGLRWSGRSDGEQFVVAVDTRRIGMPSWLEATVQQALRGPTTAASLAASGVGVDEPDALVVLKRLVRERLVVPLQDSS